jgi:hypothetical protein
VHAYAEKIMYASWIDREIEMLKEGGGEGGRDTERNTGKISYAYTTREKAGIASRTHHLRMQHCPSPASSFII